MKGKQNMNTHDREKFQTVESFKKEYGVHICTSHTGKMTGFASLSTSPIANTFCQNRTKCKGTICAMCYSMRMQSMYSALDKVLVKNHEILTSQIIPVEKWPVLNYLMFRLESFGDIQNEIQVINYFNLCKRNPRVQFTIWTKNYAIFDKLLRDGYMGVKYEKPKNLILIISSPVVNQPVKIESFPYADKIFTVYSKEYAALNGVKINCGALSCMTCQKCYNPENETVYINELLK